MDNVPREQVEMIMDSNEAFYNYRMEFMRQVAKEKDNVENA